MTLMSTWGIIAWAESWWRLGCNDRGLWQWGNDIQVKSTERVESGDLFYYYLRVVCINFWTCPTLLFQNHKLR